MLKDAYGNGLSTTSADARDAYDLGVRRFLGAEPGVEAAFNAAIEADADFALAHIGLARELQLRAERDRVNACIARADELSAGLTPREASHIHTSTLLLTGKGADARRHVYEHVKEWPRDVLIAQMCAGVFGLIGFSGSPGRESEQLSFLSGIAPAYGDDWWLLSQLAFAQLEVGQLEQAETNIEAALDGNSDSAHSKHVKAHLFYEQLRDDEGLDYLTNQWKAYDPSASLYNHISWHVGLWSLESGQLDQMWQVLDDHIAPEVSSGPPLNVLTDHVALLFRAELAGVDVPAERWTKLSDYALAKFPKPGLGFADMHAAIAHAKGGRPDRVEDIIERARGPVADLTKLLARGFLQMASQNWREAAGAFVEVQPGHARLGGSNAQRDLIDFSLAVCLARDGRRKEARTVLSITRPRAIRKELLAGV